MPGGQLSVVCDGSVPFLDCDDHDFDGDFALVYAGELRKRRNNLPGKSVGDETGLHCSRQGIPCLSVRER